MGAGQCAGQVPEQPALSVRPRRQAIAALAVDEIGSVDACRGCRRDRHSDGYGVGATASANLTTTPKVYRAFTPHGNSVFRTRLRHGSCFVGAGSINRRDAWRCTGGHLIYDPCFSSSKRPGIVLCPNDPWLGTGVKLRLTARLQGGNGPAPSTRARPWALELYDGRRCQVITGASSILQGQRANFDCGRKQDVLWGNPDRSTAPWTIFTAPFDAQALSARAAIRYAWM